MNLIKHAQDYNQRDNKHAPGSECMMTSCGVSAATVLNRDGVEHGALDDIFIEQYRANQSEYDKIKDDIARRWGLLKYWSPLRGDQIYLVAKKIVDDCDYPVTCEYKDVDADDVKRAIDAGCPVVVGTDFTGKGHVISILGYDDKNKIWIVVDTWGNATTGYRDHNGFLVQYGYGAKAWRWNQGKKAPALIFSGA